MPFQSPQKNLSIEKFKNEKRSIAMPITFAMPGGLG